MKIIKPYYEILDELDGEKILKKIEICGRTCYKSEDRITHDSCKKFVETIICRGHESVLEHVGFTVRFVCDRGVSHEIVRHRLASYSQESTRYCNYGNQGEITVIAPCFVENDSIAYANWRAGCKLAEESYLRLLSIGFRPEEARTVLPNSLKTEVVMTANLREWRHFLKMRTNIAAHPQIRELAIPLLEELREKIPVVFADI